jgi:hypothetical protein
LASSLLRDRVGQEHGLGLLVRSGLWGTFSEAARCIAPVLVAMGERQETIDPEFKVCMSYVGISRYSGVRSPNAVRKAVVELTEIGFLRPASAFTRRTPANPAATYIVTPVSDDLWENANAYAARLKQEIAAEKELRKRARQQRIRSLRDAA